MFKSSYYEKALLLLKNGSAEEALAGFVHAFRCHDIESEKALLLALKILDALHNDDLYIALLKEASGVLKPADKWLATLAEKYMSQGNYALAIEHIEQALVLNPNNSTAMINKACWVSGRLGDGVESRELFEKWGQCFMDPLTDQAAPLAVKDRSINKRLRIGYVSGDLKNHSVRYFIEGYLRYHDRHRFEVHAFMTLPGDEVSEWLKPLVDRWHDVDKLDDQQLHRLIRSLEIDILVDLSGHTRGERLAVFAGRAAPVQVTWFGFMQTLGMKAMDWRLTDASATPPGAESYYTEKLYRLECMVSYTPPLNADELYQSPWRENGYVTMVCLNHSRKISDEALVAWKEILLRNPKSGLILISSEKDPEAHDYSLHQRLEYLGLPTDRISITGRLTMAAFMRMASVADFALDSFPVSGGTTTLHALWMGLPTLALNRTVQGATQGATAAIQIGCGLSDAIAYDEDDYIKKAGEWIGCPEKIDSLRVRCRPGLQSSPMMDYRKRISELEAAYLSMWCDQ